MTFQAQPRTETGQVTSVACLESAPKPEARVDR